MKFPGHKCFLCCPQTIPLSAHLLNRHKAALHNHREANSHPMRHSPQPNLNHPAAHLHTPCQGAQIVSRTRNQSRTRSQNNHHSRNNKPQLASLALLSLILATASLADSHRCQQDFALHQHALLHSYSQIRCHLSHQLHSLFPHPCHMLDIAMFLPVSCIPPLHPPRLTQHHSLPVELFPHHLPLHLCLPLLK